MTPEEKWEELKVRIQQEYDETHKVKESFGKGEMPVTYYHNAKLVTIKRIQGFIKKLDNF